MAGVTRDGDGFVVEASVVAEVLGITEDEVRPGMQSGAITTICETGSGEDAGRWRLTFQHGGRAGRLVVDAQGTILRRASFPARRGKAPAGPRP